MKRLVISALLVGLAAVGNAENVPIKQVFVSSQLEVAAPAFSNFKDIKGATFDSKQLMKSGMDLNDISLVNSSIYLNGKNADSQWRKMDADSGVVKIIPTNIKNNKVGYVLLFVDNQFFVKGNFDVVYPYYAELYIDGEKVGDKYDFTEKGKNPESISGKFTFTPRQHQILIKYFIPAQVDSTLTLKVALDVPKAMVEALSLNSGQRPYTINDVLEGAKVARMSISPSGKFAKVLISKVNTTSGKVTYEEKFYNVENGREVFVPSKDNSTEWMNTGSRLWWTDEANGNALMTYDVATGTLTEVAKGLNEKGNYTWSPDEKFLLYNLTSDDKIEEKGPMVQILSPEDRQPGWRDRSFLYKLDLTTGLSSRITFGNHSTYLVDISPDSKYAYVSVYEDRYTERPFSVSNLYRISLSDNAVDTIWKNQKFIGDVKLSPNGKMLLVAGGPEAFGKIGQNIKNAPIANSYDNQLFLYDLSTGTVRPLTKNFDPSVDNAQWLSDSKTVILTVSEKDRNQLYSLNVSSDSFTKLPVEIDVVNGASVAKEGDKLVYYGQHYNYPARAFVYDLKSKKSMLLLDPAKQKMEQIQLGKMEDWNFTSQDGTVIEGRVYLPPHFDPSKKYPLIVNYYGGTTPVERNFESRYPLHLYATMGYVVYVLQPSGTIGYGQEFSARHVNAWGIKTADEIIEGTKKFIAEHPFVDSAKVGCIGASYGGFMTQYLQTKTNIFATAISHAGISDITSYWGEGYWGYTYSAGASADSYPWNNKDLYVNQSPLFSADKINTPILFIHGQQDTNVPIGESIQMYTALKILGKPAEFVTVEGQNHTITGYKQRIAWNNTIFAWFAKYLQNDDSWWKTLYPEKNL